VPMVYRCDWCGEETENLRGWYIVDLVDRRGKLLICSAGCLGEVAREAQEHPVEEPVTPPRRWWQRRGHAGVTLDGG
jgi:hypothetical protein